MGEITKEELWKTHDEIEKLRYNKKIFGLSEFWQNRLDNLEIIFAKQWSDFKDGDSSEPTIIH